MFTETGEYIFRGSRLLTSLAKAIAGDKRAELRHADDYHQCLAEWLLQGQIFLFRRRTFGKLINHRLDDQALAQGLGDLVEAIFDKLPGKMAKLIANEPDAEVATDLREVLLFIVSNSFLIRVTFGLEIGQYLYEDYRRLEKNKKKLAQMLTFGAFSRQVVKALFGRFSWYKPQMLTAKLMTTVQDFGFLDLLPVESFFKDVSIRAKTMGQAFYHYRFEEPISLRVDGISLHTKEERFLAWTKLKAAYQAEKNAVGKTLFELAKNAELEQVTEANEWLISYIWTGSFSRLIHSQFFDDPAKLQFAKQILMFTTPEDFQNSWRVFATEEDTEYVFYSIQALLQLLTFLAIDPHRYPEFCLVVAKQYMMLMQGLYALVSSKAVSEFDTFLGLNN